MTSRFLITTADERSWRFDRSALFLGEWCRLHERRYAWEGMDAVVANPVGLAPGEKNRNVAYVHELSGHLVKALGEALNRLHGTTHQYRHWNIILGHWLMRFVGVSWHRHEALHRALDRFASDSTIVLDTPEYSLATADSRGIIWAASDALWNHVLIARMLVPAGIAVEKGATDMADGFSDLESQPRSTEPTMKRRLLNAVNPLAHRLVRRNDAMVANSYLPTSRELLLQMSLGQMPQLWRTPSVPRFKPDRRMRTEIELTFEGRSNFEAWVAGQLPDAIPACFLEGFAELNRIAGSQPWPADPRFVFTSNNFDLDEVFKVWTAKQVSHGTPYFAGQHGNNYGTRLTNEHWPEMTECDRFFSWGWCHRASRDVAAFVFKVASTGPRCWNRQGGLLLIEIHPSLQLDPFDSYFEHGIYQEEQFRFAAALPEMIRNELNVRLHIEHWRFSWNEPDRWRERDPSVRLDAGTRSIAKETARSRLVVHSYDSTGILETLALNIPTLCFWHGGLDYLLPSAKPYYELLRSAGILLDTPEQAAAAVASHWEDVEGWWNSESVQSARKAFCDQYARTVPHPVRTLKRLLLQHAAEVRAQNGTA